MENFKPATFGVCVPFVHGTTMLLLLKKYTHTDAQTPAPQSGTKIVQHSVNKLLKLKVAFGIFGRQECYIRFPEHYKKVVNRKSMHSSVKFMLLSSAFVCAYAYVCVRV